MSYQPPVRDYAFILRDLLELERYANLPAFADASMDTVDQILEEAARFTSEVLAPLNSVGDKEGCHWAADNTVTTPKGFKEAYRQLVDGGWPGLGSDPAYGGQGLPHVVNLAFSEMSSAANMAFSMYPGLTHGAYSAIHAAGTQAQKDLYLPKLASFEWGGTMNLTEPQCGTDLGLLRTKAVPQADGHVRDQSDQKIWISGGEQDLTDNIIHLVLARIEGAPAAGCAAISLFIVPKFLPDRRRRSPEPRAIRSVKCLGLEEKMGIHGNATCVMAYEEATGLADRRAQYRPLAWMFVMMNEAAAGRRPARLVAGRGRSIRPPRPSPATALQGRSFAQRREEPGRAGRSDHRPSRHPPHADGRQGHAGGRPRLPAVGRAARRPDARQPRRGGPRKGLRLHGPADPGAEGLPDRPGLQDLFRRHAGARRVGLHRAFPGQPVPARYPHHHDL